VGGKSSYAKAPAERKNRAGILSALPGLAVSSCCSPQLTLWATLLSLLRSFRNPARSVSNVGVSSSGVADPNEVSNHGTRN